MDNHNHHVLILPFPAQGHIKPMLNLASLLLLSQPNFTVTFVNTDYNHRRMNHPNSNIRFLSIPDGLAAEHTRTGMSAIDLFFSISKVGKPALKELIASMNLLPSCIISDGIMSFAIDVGEEMGIPVFTFRTYSATCTWVYFHLEKLVQLGEIPVLEGKDMDELITCIPSLETILRHKDLPSICQFKPENPILQFYITQTSKMTKASALILNTFEDLEPSFIAHLRSIFPSVYTIGPLHAALKSNMTDSHKHLSSSSLMQMDETCMNWLDSQPSNSVLYVSFGSVIELSKEELMEFWHGLVNSGTLFLWAIRPDLVGDESQIPEEIVIRTKERGRIVSWAPQEDVLAHDAVGGFLTHSGWNSTLESICAGKPMICWPRLADQQVNSRCVSEMWEVGLDMKGVCDRLTVEKMVRHLMGSRREEIAKMSNKIERLAKYSLMDGGSTNRNIKKLIEDIKSINCL